MSDTEKSREELQQEIDMLMQQINEMSASAHEMIKAQSHLESVLHNAGEGVILYNADGTIKSLNLAAQNILGYQEVELMYQYAPFLFNAPEQYNENVPAFLKNYVAEHPDTILEPLIARHYKGHELPLQISISEVAAQDMVFFDDFSGDADGDTVESYELFACIFRDLSSEIDAKKTLEEKNTQLEHAYVSLSEHDRIRSEFLAKISHELLTPLNGIIGMAEMLEDDVKEEQKEFVHVIRESGLRLDKIINNILSFDKASELNAEKKQFNLVELLTSYEEKFSKVLLTKKLGLSIDIDEPDKVPEFFALYDHIQHILDNLIDNALKFTETGGVQIHLLVEEHDELSRKITLSIQDSGIGISEQDQEKIFHPFTQLEDTVTRQFGGVGMGLAIVKQLLESLDGDLKLESQPGQGTTITIYMILETAEDQLRAHSSVDEEKLGQLKQLMEDDFTMLIETSISELHTHHQKLKDHVSNHEEKGVFASCTMLKNIADQLGSNYLINLLDSFHTDFSKKQGDNYSKDEQLEHCHIINEEIKMIDETLQHYLIN